MHNVFIFSLHGIDLLELRSFGCKMLSVKDDKFDRKRCGVLWISLCVLGISCEMLYGCWETLVTSTVLIDDSRETETADFVFANALLIQHSTHRVENEFLLLLLLLPFSFISGYTGIGSSKCCKSFDTPEPFDILRAYHLWARSTDTHTRTYTFGCDKVDSWRKHSDTTTG